MDRKGLALMSQDNQITLRGYLTAEPKLHQKTQAATPVTEIRVGSSPRRLNRETGEWQEAAASYYTVKCWRRLAINAASSLHKGDMVVIRGRFYMNRWVDNQQRPRATLEIEADSVGHDLAYGWSHFLRGSRPQSERADGVNEGEMARQDTGPDGPGDRDDEYSAGNGPGDPGDPGETAGQGEPGYPGFAGDPTALTPPMPRIADGDEADGHDPGDVPVASGLTADASLPEPEAVPF
jgi:single-strand DNA-binding protein